jgi:hypothetical protein
MEQGGQPPELVVLHLQEFQSQFTAPLNLLGYYSGYSTVPSQPDPLLKKWTSFMSKALENRFPEMGYECIYSGHLIAIGLMVFAGTATKEPLVSGSGWDGSGRSRRLEIEGTHVGSMDTGLLGVYGNKGCVACSLDLKITSTTATKSGQEESYFLSLCVASLHLGPHSGEIYFNWRNSEFQSLFDTLLLYPVSGHGCPRLLLDHDVLILAGDLNYRLFDIERNTLGRRYGLPSLNGESRTTKAGRKVKPFEMGHERVCEWIDSGDVSRILKFDELNYARHGLQIPPLDSLQEAPIRFLPTYKLVIPKSMEKSLGEKKAVERFSRKRVPAYTDRILYKSVSTPVKILGYESVQGLGFSDHQPVRALFELELQKKRHEYLVHEERSLVMGVRVLRLRRFLSINSVRLVVFGVVVIWYFILMS